MGRKHDDVARRIARQQKTDYNPGQGPDVKGRRATIEVETARTLGDAGRQLQGCRGPVYVAVTDQKDVPTALDRYGRTTVGVMKPDGSIAKRSTRRR